MQTSNEKAIKIHVYGAIRNGRKIHGVSDESNYGKNVIHRLAVKIRPNDTAHADAKFAVEFRMSMLARPR